MVVGDEVVTFHRQQQTYPDNVGSISWLSRFCFWHLSKQNAIVAKIAL